MYLCINVHTKPIGLEHISQTMSHTSLCVSHPPFYYSTVCLNEREKPSPFYLMSTVIVATTPPLQAGQCLISTFVLIFPKFKQIIQPTQNESLSLHAFLLLHIRVHFLRLWLSLNPQTNLPQSTALWCVQVSLELWIMWNANKLFGKRNCIKESPQSVLIEKIQQRQKNKPPLSNFYSFGNDSPKESNTNSSPVSWYH